MTTYRFSTSTEQVCELDGCENVTALGHKYCTDDHRKKATRHTARDHHRVYDKRFIGVDGEGVTVVKPDGSREHRYVMLSVGDDTLWDKGEALQPFEIFQFLYSHFESNAVDQHEGEAVYVGFYLGYDFTMWLKGLPERCGRLLFSPAGIASRQPNPMLHKGRAKNPTPFPVKYMGWEFDMLGMKRLKLRPESRDVKGKPRPWLYICDVGSFFQTSFLNVINPARWVNGNAPCSEREYEMIKAGKTARGLEVAENDRTYYRDMVRYNRLENRILSRVMTQYHHGLVDAGVRLNRENYYGPGQAAQKWLDLQVRRGKFLSHEQLDSVMKSESKRFALDAARESYYGGRFEVFFHGHVPGVTYEYDIVSAYPDIMRRLPCLCSGRWQRGNIAFGLHPIRDKLKYDVLFLLSSVRGSDRRVGGLPLRTDKGSIVYGDLTQSWFLADEVDAADRAGLLAERWETEWVGFKRSCKHPPPLAMLADMFSERQRIGKSTPYGIALKLIMNSLYGKFAQSVGSPKYGNPIYASMITALTRVKILDAIATHPNGLDDLVMIATDGVYFRTPHPKLDAIAAEGEQLGGWERAELSNLTIMKPGVYWHDKARQGSSLKSRGISAASLRANIARLDSDFRTFHDALSQIAHLGHTLTSPRTVPDAGLELPELHIPIPFSVTSPRLAMARGDWSKAGQVSWNDTRDDVMVVWPKRTNLRAEGPYIRSDRATAPHDDVVSVPYSKRFGFDIEEREEEMGYSQTGPALPEFFHELAERRDVV